MINLLPPDTKKQLAAARTNSLLARYSVLLTIAVALLGLEIFGMSFMVDLGKSQNEATIADNESKTASYASTKQQAEAFRANLATASSILGKQVSYTHLIFALAGGLPEGAVIDNVSLDPATFGTPTTMVVRTTSYQKAIDVKTSLQNAKVNGTTPLFSSVNFQSVAASDSPTKYGYTATLNVTYNKEALAQ